MSQDDILGDAIERLEWDDRKLPDSAHKRLRQFTRRTALTGGAAAIAATVLEACGSSSSTTSKAATSGGGGTFGNSGSNHFVMVNHVTTNSFFTDTVRMPGRLRTDRLLVPVDGLQQLDRQ